MCYRLSWPKCWVHLIWSAGMSTHLHVTGHSTIIYRRCKAYLTIANFWIIAILSPSTIPLSYDLYECTSHLLAAWNLSVTACFLIKVMVLRNNSWKRSYWLECLAFALSLTFDTIVTSNVSALRACCTLPPWKFHKNFFPSGVDAPQGYWIWTKLAHLKYFKGLQLTPLPLPPRALQWIVM